MITTSRQRRRRGEVEIPELNVTPFMNLMIVLVPVLLLSLVFTHTTVIELDFPAPNAAAASEEQPFHLEVRILESELVVADNRGILKRLPMVDGAHDYEGLNLTLQSVKQRVPEQRRATILLESNTPYQSLVSVMDSVRSYKLQSLQAELFPDVSLGDVPTEDQEAT